MKTSTLIKLTAFGFILGAIAALFADYVVRYAELNESVWSVFLDKEKWIQTETTSPVISCADDDVNGLSYLQCYSSVWGRWEVYLWNPETELRVPLWFSVYNDSTGGGPFTNEQGSVIIRFIGENGLITETNYIMNAIEDSFEDDTN